MPRTKESEEVTDKVKARLRKELGPALTLARDGNYKLHIEERGSRIIFKEVPGEDLSPYRNDWSLLA